MMPRTKTMTTADLPVAAPAKKPRASRSKAAVAARTIALSQQVAADAELDQAIGSLEIDDEPVHRTSPMPVVLQLVSDHIADRAAEGRSSILALTPTQREIVADLEAANLKLNQAEGLTKVALHDLAEMSRIIESQAQTIADLKFSLKIKQDVCNELGIVLAQRGTEIKELTAKLVQRDAQLSSVRAQLSDEQLEVDDLKTEVERLSEHNLTLVNRGFVARLFNRGA